jgi:hypothetical protein
MSNEHPQDIKGSPADAPAPDISILEAYTHAKQAIGRQIRQIRQDQQWSLHLNILAASLLVPHSRGTAAKNKMLSSPSPAGRGSG